VRRRASKRLVLGCTFAVLVVVLILHLFFCRWPASVTPGAGGPTVSTPGAGGPTASTPGAGGPTASTPGAGGPTVSTPGAGGPTASTQGPRDRPPRVARVDQAGSVTISGNTTELISPGVRVPLDLKLTNPHAFALTATGLRVTVQKISAPHADNAHPCTIGDFAVDQPSSGLKITVAAHSTRTLSNLGLPPTSLPHVGMLNRPVNQDGCKGASLTLAYTASGEAD
jgi:hypothetical protein